MSQVATIERFQTSVLIKPLTQASDAPATPPVAPASDEAAEAPPHAPGTDLPSIAGRDFASALDLIREASDAVRASEARANDLEHQFGQLSTRAAEQIRSLEAQAAAAERRMRMAEERARAAEARATSAEAWLIRMHDAVLTSFKQPGRSERGE